MVFLYISIPIYLVLIKEHFPPSPKFSQLYTPRFSPHRTALPVSPSDSVALVPRLVAISLSLPWPQALSSLRPFSYQGLVSVKMKAIKSSERGNWNNSLKKSVWVYLLPLPLLSWRGHRRLVTYLLETPFVIYKAEITVICVLLISQTYSKDQKQEETKKNPGKCEGSITATPMTANCLTELPLTEERRNWRELSYVVMRWHKVQRVKGAWRRDPGWCLG